MSGHVLGWPLFALKIAPSCMGSGPPSNTWFLGPIRVHNPKGISMGSAVFAGPTIVTNTDRPTDRQRNRVCNNKPQL